LRSRSTGTGDTEQCCRSNSRPAQQDHLLAHKRRVFLPEVHADSRVPQAGNIGKTGPGLRGAPALPFALIHLPSERAFLGKPYAGS
jgi:hypothetical protein